jgi:TetR/AcrR family transcriptional repressor of nem operon
LLLLQNIKFHQCGPDSPRRPAGRPITDSGHCILKTKLGSDAVKRGFRRNTADKNAKIGLDSGMTPGYSVPNRQFVQPHRIPMSTTSKGEKTRDHILKATRKILVVQGFHNTSISAVIEATGVKKGNLYYHFASKEELGLAVLEDAKDDFFSFLAKVLTGSNPVEKIINSCRAILQEQQKNNFVGGCLFGNTALEMTDSNQRFSVVVQDVFLRWTEILEEHLTEARENGLLPPSTQPRLLAKTVVATLEGGIMMSRVSKNKNDLNDFLAAISGLLGR